MLLEANYGTFFSNKSAQFFYFWARTRLVQRVIMVLSALWIILIFYKSMLIVELMRHDVNVNKETVEALLPKGMGLPQLIKHNYLFTSTAAYNTVASSSPPVNQAHDSTTIDYFKRHFQKLVLPSPRTRSAFDHESGVVLEDRSSFDWESQGIDQRATKFDDIDYHSWKSLSPNHWLSLFSYYNMSLYNRYVAILPQINLYR